MHRSTTTHQPKSFEPPTTDVALIDGCLRKSLFGWIAAPIPVQPHKCSTFGLRGVAVRMHWSTAADQPKSYESCLTVVTLIEGCPRKRNSAKQALRETQPNRL